MQQKFAHLCHGASHLPLSGRLMRMLVLVFGLVTAYYAATSDSLVLALLTAAAVAACGLIATLELHEAATACDQANEDDDDQGDEFGRAA